ncbi:ABC transporter B family member 19-like [Alnus glutinosa]|uniref:ABC transporter B family member 19-like n=1 Tax=Alnus glutinosa TaxID=3517 RepID=UPI002D774E0B|nr:ABC transporter B family member 19-like [Alnus glutinosa]
MAEATEAKTLPEAEKKKEQSLPFYQLFAFADKYDWLLMVSGSLGAIIHGSSMPVFFLLFGEMVNGSGKNQSDLKKMTEEVSKELDKDGNNIAYRGKLFCLVFAYGEKGLGPYYSIISWQFFISLP